jgi:hypothetical protein
MKRGHFIGLDVHCAFTEVVVVRETGNVVLKEGCATTIPTLVTIIPAVCHDILHFSARTFATSPMPKPAFAPLHLGY